MPRWTLPSSLMCGIVVSVAIKGAEDARRNTDEGRDIWETLVRLNTPRGAPPFTLAPDPACLVPSDNTERICIYRP